MDNGATFRTTQTIDIGPAGTCAAVAGQPDTFGRIDRCRRRKRKALGKRVGEKEATPEGRGRGVRRHGTEEGGVHALSAAQRRAQAVHYFLRTEEAGAVDYLLGDDSGSAEAASPGKQSACTHAPSQDADAKTRTRGREDGSAGLRNGKLEPGSFGSFVGLYERERCAGACVHAVEGTSTLENTLITQLRGPGALVHIL